MGSIVARNVMAMSLFFLDTTHTHTYIWTKPHIGARLLHKKANSALVEAELVKTSPSPTLSQLLIVIY